MVKEIGDRHKVLTKRCIGCAEKSRILDMHSNEILLWGN